jgi:hypothetical protein
MGMNTGRLTRLVEETLAEQEELEQLNESPLLSLLSVLGPTVGLFVGVYAMSWAQFNTGTINPIVAIKHLWSRFKSNSKMKSILDSYKDHKDFEDINNKVAKYLKSNVNNRWDLAKDIEKAIKKVMSKKDFDEVIKIINKHEDSRDREAVYYSDV